MSLYALTQTLLDRLNKLWRWRANIKITGDGVTMNNTEAGLTVCIRQIPQFPKSFASSFDIRITGHTQDGTNKRWKYDWEMVTKSTAGYGGWAALSTPVTGHNSTYDYAYNRQEDVNGSSGLYGNGVNSSNLTGTLDIQPIVTGTIHRAFFVSPATPNSDGSPEVWFSAANGINGGCT